MDYRKPAECLEMLAQLHPLDVDETHRTLSAMVATLQQAQPPANQHLEVLEAARVQVAQVQAAFSRRYAAQPLPPDSEENNTLMRVVELWRALAAAYALIARQDAAQHTLADQHALLWQRRVFYIGQAILDFLRAHRAVPAALWAELLDCTAQAENAAMLRVRVADELNAVWGAQSALEACISVLLVELANPYGRGEHEFELICRWAQRFAPYCELQAQPDRQRKGAYALNVPGEHALRPISQLADGPQLRGFDCLRLATQLQSTYAELKQGATPAALQLGEDCSPAAAARLLLSLYRPWGLASAGRRFPRRGAYGEAAVCGDWLAIGFHVAGKVFEQPSVLDETRSLRSDIGLLTFGERAPTVEHDLDAREREVLAARLGFACVHWRVADQSVSGFRLVQLCEHERLEHHQLIGVRPPDGEHYLLGQISWLMYRADGIMEAGVQVLPGRPQVVAARILTLQSGNNRTPYAQAFLVPANAGLKTPAALVLPQRWFQPNRVIEVWQDEAPQQYRLVKTLLRGPNFEQCSFEVVRARD